MHVFLEDSGRLAASTKASSLVIGNFDGFHRGHQRLLQRCKEESTRRGLAKILFTFEPHPSKILRPLAQRPKLLFTLEEKKFLASLQDLDAIIFQKFDQAFMKLKAQDFVKEHLLKNLRTQVAVVGENFRFGFKGQGSAADLRSAGIEVFIEPTLLADSVPVSSTLIRNAVMNGEMDKANHLLGFPYFMSGRVIAGEQRGRELGYPTANLQTHKECLPSSGVYATMVENVKTATYCLAVTNLGMRPTFGENRFTVETHILDFNKDLYDQELRIFCLRRLRDEKKFSNLDELKLQIAQDVANARTWFLQNRVSSTQFRPFEIFS